MHGEMQDAVAARHVAGAPDVNFSGESHVSEHREQHVLEMKGRRGKILEEASSQFDGKAGAC